MPAVHGFHRPSSTKGKHIHLSSPALAKGLACSKCKERKIRCDGVKPSCSSCRRTARFEGRIEEDVVCCYEGKKCGTRKSRKASAEHEEEHKPMVEDALPLPPVVPFPQPAEVNLDTSIEFSDLASRLFAFNHLTEVESNFSAISLDRPSSSTSSSFDLPASSSASSISYTYLDSSFLPTYYPSQVLSSSPLPMLDSSDYFAALQSAPSISTTSFDSFDSFDSSSSKPYPSYGLSSLFLAAPAPQSISAEPSYFDMPPPIEKQEWPEQQAQIYSATATTKEGLEVGGIPLTPGWSIDYSAFAELTALF